MGFKRVNNKDLETSLSSSFLGVPLKRIEVSSDVKQTEEKEQSSIIAGSGVSVLNEERVDFVYDNKKLLKNFNGNGIIIVSNESKKDRIWDVKLVLSKNQNINLERENKVVLGNFEPKINKKLNYSILKTDNLPDPILIKEKFNILNVSAQKLDVFGFKPNIGLPEVQITQVSDINSVIQEKKQKEQVSNEIKPESNHKEQVEAAYVKEIENLKKIHNTELSKIQEEVLKKDIAVMKEFEEKFSPKIKSTETKIKSEETNLSEAVKNVADWNAKVKKVYEDLKTLKAEKEELSNEKEKTLKKKLKELSKGSKKNIKQNPDLKVKLEQEEKQKENELNQEIEKEYGATIKDIDSRSTQNREAVEYAKNKITEWGEKEKKVRESLENLRNESNSLVKSKETLINEKLNENSVEKDSKVKKTTEEFQNKLNKAEAERQQKIKAIEENFRKELQKNEEIKRIKLKREEEIRQQAEKGSAAQSTSQILLFNKENSVVYRFDLENTSNYPIDNIKIVKDLAKEFYDFKYECNVVSDIEINKGKINCAINSLKPKEKAEITIFCKIHPKVKKIVGTGTIFLNYEYQDYVISGNLIEKFSAYSNAFNAISIKEKEREPNQWDCALIFKNNSDLSMELKSIQIMDKKKQKNHLDIDFSKEELNNKIVRPGDTYKTKNWEVINNTEPKFYQKLDYSIIPEKKYKTNVNITIEECVFDIVDLDIIKKFSTSEIKSFEQSDIENIITIKNIGTIPIDGIFINEEIPIDFNTLLNPLDFKVRISSGKNISEQVKINVSPLDIDHQNPHTIKLAVMPDIISSDPLIGVNQFLEIKYPLKAITPDYKKNYNFPMEVVSLYSASNNIQEGKNKIYYSVSNVLDKKDLPKLSIIHNRRDLIIGKEIFPGRTVSEFVINITVINNSNIELKNIDINDAITKSVEIVSSNAKYVVIEGGDPNISALSFKIENILPNQEKEIRYYVQNKSGETIDYEKLEAHVFG